MRFDSYHPLINLIYFVSALTFIVLFSHPVFIAIAYFGTFAYSVKLNGKKALLFNIALIPVMIIYTAVYSMYHHFGITALFENFAGNDMTAESIIYGSVISVKAASFIMMMSCVFCIFSADKVVYLSGRISPRLSLFVSIILRSVPRIKRAGRQINLSQKGIGRGVFQKGRTAGGPGIIRFISIIITWILDSFVEVSVSMKSRGYLLKGRTAYSLYRFDNRDRLFVVFMSLCITITVLAEISVISFAQYDPEIIIKSTEVSSFIYYVAYAFLLLAPMMLQIISEKRFKKLRASRP